LGNTALKLNVDVLYFTHFRLKTGNAILTYVSVLNTRRLYISNKFSYSQCRRFHAARGGACAPTFTNG